ncbi:hypothetical protein [Kaistella jeonii]|uniref:Uncharacterized protein n=1 Tax=Kaistella jeonii TaxID=266749 RepID=A0A0C1CVY8_9FLAO|nr:hypothetical protein [Kaistella jeonii]KIA88511.1 hypothetical protein OA86_10800 [Kaistella jeonii]SFC19588.1 hypothetical protein SAMN05421876_10912 [Kaistella jeonii]VEI97025.1 Uncharacterised protein [Kaistella jeonii]
MARQKGLIKLKGTMGDITFYRTRDGYMAREKGGISAERMRTDPAFQRTRENMAEFGRAGKAGKTLRNSMQSLLRTAADPRMVSRLTKEMVKVIQMDATNPRGQRNVIDGEAELLQGFEFNISGKLGTSIVAPFTATLDRVTGDAIIDIEAYVPTDSVIAPAGSTHYKMVSAAMDINFESETFASEKNETPVLPLSSVLTAPLQLNNNLPTASTNPLFLVFGISFYQEVNGTFYELKNGAYNALQIVKVDGTP